MPIIDTHTAQSLFVTRLLAGTLSVFICAATVSDSLAVKPHRCKGRIQFTPCTQEESASTSTLPPRFRSRITGASDPRFPIKGSRFAEVVTSSFAQLNRSTGLWSGTIRGNGLIETELVILRSGSVESSRYMGHVWLQNKSTPFKITSALPRGKGWGWRINVWAR